MIRPTWNSMPAPEHTFSTLSSRNRPTDDFELGLMKQLACMCPTCDRKPIEECECDFANRMRGEVKHELAGRDLSTDDARRRAAEAVRAHFVAAYGADVMVAQKRDRLGRFRWFPVVLS